VSLAFTIGRPAQDDDDLPSPAALLRRCRIEKRFARAGPIAKSPCPPRPASHRPPSASAPARSFHCSSSHSTARCPAGGQHRVQTRGRRHVEMCRRRNTTCATAGGGAPAPARRHRAANPTAAKRRWRVASDIPFTLPVATRTTRRLRFKRWMERATPLRCASSTCASWSRRGARELEALEPTWTVRSSSSIAPPANWHVVSQPDELLAGKFAGSRPTSRWPGKLEGRPSAGPAIRRASRSTCPGDRGGDATLAVKSNVDQRR